MSKEEKRVWILYDATDNPVYPRIVCVFSSEEEAMKYAIRSIPLRVQVNRKTKTVTIDAIRYRVGSQTVHDRDPWED